MKTIRGGAASGVANDDEDDVFDERAELLVISTRHWRRRRRRRRCNLVPMSDILCIIKSGSLSEMTWLFQKGGQGVKSVIRS